MRKALPRFIVTVSSGLCSAALSTNLPAPSQAPLTRLCHEATKLCAVDLLASAFTLLPPTTRAVRISVHHCRRINPRVRPDVHREPLGLHNRRAGGADVARVARHVRHRAIRFHSCYSTDATLRLALRRRVMSTQSPSVAALGILCRSPCIRCLARRTAHLQRCLLYVCFRIYAPAEAYDLGTTTGTITAQLVALGVRLRLLKVSAPA